MFDRLQKPFLTVETGEAYQPIRISYEILQPEKLADSLEKLQCIEKNPTPNSWSWYWRAECDGLHFESVDGYRKTDKPLRLGTITLREGFLYLNLPSFKRACLAVPFLHPHLLDVLKINAADFINKVFALDERLPHGFSELFKDDELDRIMNQRIEDYHKVKEQCEMAESPEEAFKLLSEFTQKEAKKRLPYAERYMFEMNGNAADPEVAFLAFYIYLRGRELVAIKRWFGQTGYSLSDAADETVVQVFGDLGIDLID
jgi:hypothetical protein